MRILCFSLMFLLVICGIDRALNGILGILLGYDGNRMGRIYITGCSSSNSNSLFWVEEWINAIDAYMTWASTMIGNHELMNTSGMMLNKMCCFACF